MKYIKQLTIILFISLISEILNKLLPLPIPSSIYGLIIMFLSLTFNIIKLDDIKETAKFLIEIMQIMFIPAGVGLIIAYDFIKDKLLIYFVMTFLSTIIVMILTGKIADYIITRKGDKTND